jgi:hypothetical protein
MGWEKCELAVSQLSSRQVDRLSGKAGKGLAAYTWFYFGVPMDWRGGYGSSRLESIGDHSFDLLVGLERELASLLKFYFLRP